MVEAKAAQLSTFLFSKLGQTKKEIKQNSYSIYGGDQNGKQKQFSKK